MLMAVVSAVAVMGFFLPVVSGLNAHSLDSFGLSSLGTAVRIEFDAFADRSNHIGHLDDEDSRQLLPLLQGAQAAAVQPQNGLDYRRFVVHRVQASGAVMPTLRVDEGAAIAAPNSVGPLSIADDRGIAMKCELHLQEGFGGETVIVEVDGAEIARVEARTRMQIGLAHIEKLGLKPGQTVGVRLPDLNLSTEHRLVAGQPFIQVRLENGALRVKATETTPGYL